MCDRRITHDVLILDAKRIRSTYIKTNNSSRFLGILCTLQHLHSYVYCIKFLGLTKISLKGKIFRRSNSSVYINHVCFSTYISVRYYSEFYIINFIIHVNYDIFNYLCKTPWGVELLLNDDESRWPKARL